MPTKWVTNPDNPREMVAVELSSRQLYIKGQRYRMRIAEAGGRGKWYRITAKVAQGPVASSKVPKARGAINIKPVEIDTGWMRSSKLCKRKAKRLVEEVPVMVGELFPDFVDDVNERIKGNHYKKEKEQ